MPKQPESRLARRITRLLRSRGAAVFNIHGGDNPFQEVGIPDLLVCFEGRFIGLELKVPGAKVKPRQALLLKRIQDAGGIAARVESVEDVERLLQRTTRKRG